MGLWAFTTVRYHANSLKIGINKLQWGCGLSPQCDSLNVLATLKQILASMGLWAFTTVRYIKSLAQLWYLVCFNGAVGFHHSAMRVSPVGHYDAMLQWGCGLSPQCDTDLGESLFSALSCFNGAVGFHHSAIDVFVVDPEQFVRSFNGAVGFHHSAMLLILS